jgi:PTH2 family peptidyl-tRNA hydrolase
MLAYLALGLVCFILGYFFKKGIFFIKSKLFKKWKIETENGTCEETESMEVEKEYDFEDLKMVFLVREDLKLGAGKIAAQVAHAAVSLYDEICENGKPYYRQALENWNEFGAKKIVLRAKDLEDLKSVKAACKKKGIPCSMIADAGRTQIEPGTITVLGIGPEESKKLDIITGEFKLMR